MMFIETTDGDLINATTITRVTVCTVESKYVKGHKYEQFFATLGDGDRVEIYESEYQRLQSTGSLIAAGRNDMAVIVTVVAEIDGGGVHAQRYPVAAWNVVGAAGADNLMALPVLPTSLCENQFAALVLSDGTVDVEGEGTYPDIDSFAKECVKREREKQERAQRAEDASA